MLDSIFMVVAANLISIILAVRAARLTVKDDKGWALSKPQRFALIGAPLTTGALLFCSAADYLYLVDSISMSVSIFIALLVLLLLCAKPAFTWLNSRWQTHADAEHVHPVQRMDDQASQPEACVETT